MHLEQERNLAGQVPAAKIYDSSMARVAQHSDGDKERGRFDCNAAVRADTKGNTSSWEYFYGKICREN